MKLHQLRADDDAVSPVIGVILMVAVTVILAAVIASFVLGLGSTVDAAPQASFSFEYSTGEVTITHQSGGELDPSRISIVVGGDRIESSNFDDGWMSSKITAGDAETITEADDGVTLATGDSVRVIWSSANSDQSTTLGSSTVP